MHSGRHMHANTHSNIHSNHSYPNGRSINLALPLISLILAFLTAAALMI